MDHTIRLLKALIDKNDFVGEDELFEITNINHEQISYLMTHAQNMGRVETRCRRIIKCKLNPSAAVIRITALGRQWYEERVDAQ